MVGEYDTATVTEKEVEDWKILNLNKKELKKDWQSFNLLV
jgi:hypothetical protein